ncbi:hypothetical protein ACFL4K_00825 [Candidatus Neomarinimicrobiota bacterium]
MILAPQEDSWGITFETSRPHLQNLKKGDTLHMTDLPPDCPEGVTEGAQFVVIEVEKISPGTIRVRAVQLMKVIKGQA